MNEIQTSKDVASMLLNSSDSKIAAAARRVFSNAVLVQTNPQEVAHSDNFSVPITGPNLQEEEGSSKNDFSSDIREAASAVVMLAPRKIISTDTIDEGPTSSSTDSTMLCKVSNERSTLQSASSCDPDSKASFTSKSSLIVERKKSTSPGERLQRR